MRLSEIYPSMQGEGPRVGTPTVFVRFAGCNLRCPGWPCDTQHAIDPEKYRSEWQALSATSVLGRILEVARSGSITNICLTGGEPFLQSHDELKFLCDELWKQGATVEAFTNGSLLWPEWAMWNIRFVMDWKLQGSGETIAPDIMMRNVSRMTAKDAIKFTVANDEDLKEAMQIWLRTFQGLERGPLAPQIYCGPVWDAMEPSDVATFILKNHLPWNLNVQVHKYIWNADTRLV